MGEFKSISGTPYSYDSVVDNQLTVVQQQVVELRKGGRLSPQVLRHLRNYFRIKNIYNSNAIEGNLLNYNETRLVVEQGLTISGKSFRDVTEAKNLAYALDLFEELANKANMPILEIDIRNLHQAVLKEINDVEAGKYRGKDVAITGSNHKPPSHAAVAGEMEKYAAWLKEVAPSEGPSDKMDPVIQACVAHTWFVYIHPFIDGNGRVSRLLLNLNLMRAGYPIAVISIEDRQRYYDCLRESDEGGDLTPLISLVTECVQESLEEYMRAAGEQRELEEFSQSLVAHFTEGELNRVKNEFAVWTSAMELLKGHFRQIADLVTEKSTGLGRLDCRDYGTLSFEKFQSLRQLRPTKQTWFFKIQMQSGNRKASYVFWFGFASQQLVQEIGRGAVTLYVSMLTDRGIFEKLDSLSHDDLPDLFEIGYAPSKEQFVWRLKGNRIATGRVEQLVKDFLAQVSKRQF